MQFKDYQKEFLLFLELERGYSDRTIEVYNRDLNQYSVFINKNRIDYCRINKEIIFDFQASLANSIGPRSFSRMLSTMRTFYKFLHTEGIVNDIVLNDIKSYPSPQYKKSIPSFLSIEQILKVMDNINDSKKLSDTIKLRNQSLIMLFFTSGLRLE